MRESTCRAGLRSARYDIVHGRGIFLLDRLHLLTERFSGTNRGQLWILLGVDSPNRSDILAPEPY